MSEPDPVMFPMSGGSVMAARQDVARSRADLADTIKALSARVHPGGQARRGLRASAAPAGATVLVGVLGALVARRIGASAKLGLVVGAIAGGVGTVAIRSQGRSRPEQGDAGRPSEMTRAQAAPATAAPDDDAVDVLDVLFAQHRAIEDKFAQVRAPGANRVQAFASLVELLKLHESAEKEIVHPALQKADPDAAEMISERRREEMTADRTIGRLISLGPGHVGFDRAFDTFEQEARDHAYYEEVEEFPLIRRFIPLDTRRRLASEVNAAQSGTW
jgi:hypothetical protein